jgi:hypothetical protein
MLQRDLSMTLIDVVRFPIAGFGKEEAREYAVTMGDHLEVDDLRVVLRTANLNPRLLDELVVEDDETREAATQVAKSSKEATTQAVLEQVYANRIVKCDVVERALVNLLAVASGPLDRKLLLRALETEVGAAKLTAERGNIANEALAELLSLRLIDRLKGKGAEPLERFVIGHDVVRRVVLAKLSDRERARYSGRIADALGVHDAKNVDLRFEYELRAARVGRAMENAADAARRAESRFAYHRAAKLWRWLVEHRDEMPTYARFEPADELARVELLAGRHDDAAELFRERAERAKDAMGQAEVRLLEARAWLQAGKVDDAIEALASGLKLTGARYHRGVLEGMRDAPTIVRAVVSRWTPDSVSDTPARRRHRVRAELAFFGAVHGTMLDTTRRDHMGALLASVAERSGDPYLLGMERIVLSNYRWRGFDEGQLESGMRRLDEADRFFEVAGRTGWRAQVAAERASLYLRHDDVDGATRALERAFAIGARAEDDGFDRRHALWLDARQKLRTGALGAAERAARKCLHVYRGDRLAESRAYEVLAKAALLKGEVERAQAYIETGRASLVTSTPNLDSIRWARLTAQLDIALGRPEVAVRQLELLSDSLRKHRLLDLGVASTALEIARGQALAAHAERQRTFGDPRLDDSLKALREVRSRLERVAGQLAPVDRAELARLFARVELLRDRTKKALRDLELGAEAIAATHAPIDIAKSTEARGHVLLKREQPEARTVMEQAWNLYREHECQYPLILEGWPIPSQASALREEA